MSRTKFMGIFLVILGVISVVVGIIRGDMTSSAAMFIGYLVPALLGAVILIVDHIGGGETKTETGPSDAALAGQKNKKKKHKHRQIRNRLRPHQRQHSQMHLHFQKMICLHGRWMGMY